MPDSYETDRYEDAPNFNNRFKVETAYPDGTIDHRKDFQQKEYFRGHETQQEPVMQPMGNMKGVVNAPKAKGGIKSPRKRKTTTPQQDADLKDAANKDLRTKGITDTK